MPISCRLGPKSGFMLQILYSIFLLLACLSPHRTVRHLFIHLFIQQIFVDPLLYSAVIHVSVIHIDTYTIGK